ncbi:ABC transporter ATP-binding protein [Salipaludibacillus sp. CF4.18]|uniref:ABC transporter ATP-binding protein n=1 Tax=Salipaludibacillus sp. CF4.18 TaxID=3373081 RepID=UPI003EE6703B
MIEFQGVSKVFADGTKAVNDLNFRIEKGELFVLIGPSGCGKTTTMKMINRLIDSSDGKIFIQDKNIRDMNMKRLRWNIGYVLQQIALFPHMTIKENISIVPELVKWPKEDISKRVDELLDMVGLDPSTYRDRMPDELSGGQQQRVGVVRALAGDPDIILMDEPFSALDPITREQLQKDILDLQKNIKKTIVFVTHDMDEALALGNRICILKEGSVVQVDTPEKLLQNPADDFVEKFIGARQDPWGAPLSEMTLYRSRTQAPLKEEVNEFLLTSHSVRAAFEKLKDSKKNSLTVFNDEKEYTGDVSYKDIVLHLEKYHFKDREGALS